MTGLTQKFRPTRPGRMLRALLAAPLALVLNTLPQTFTPAAALPQSITCRITTYFSTAAKEDVVGVRTTCPGGERWGRVTQHREIEVVTLDVEGPSPAGGGGGPGGLPCEFLAKGCSNLPTRRFN